MDRVSEIDILIDDKAGEYYRGGHGYEGTEAGSRRSFFSRRVHLRELANKMLEGVKVKEQGKIKGTEVLS